MNAFPGKDEVIKVAKELIERAEYVVSKLHLSGLKIKLVGEIIRMEELCNLLKMAESLTDIAHYEMKIMDQYRKMEPDVHRGEEIIKNSTEIFPMNVKSNLFII